MRGRRPLGQTDATGAHHPQALACFYPSREAKKTETRKTSNGLSPGAGCLSHLRQGLCALLVSLSLSLSLRYPGRQKKLPPNTTTIATTSIQGCSRDGRLQHYPLRKPQSNKVPCVGLPSLPIRTLVSFGPSKKRVAHSLALAIYLFLRPHPWTLWASGTCPSLILCRRAQLTCPRHGKAVCGET
jgi:hypothetical protein